MLGAQRYVLTVTTRKTGNTKHTWLSYQCERCMPVFPSRQLGMRKLITWWFVLSLGPGHTQLPEAGPELANSPLNFHSQGWRWLNSSNDLCTICMTENTPDSSPRPLRSDMLPIFSAHHHGRSKMYFETSFNIVMPPCAQGIELHWETPSPFVLCLKMSTINCSDQSLEL